LVDLDPAGLDRVRGAKCAADVVGPDVGSKPVVTVVRHTDGVRIVGPGNGDEHGTEDLLTRKAPVVRHIRENGGDRVVAVAKPSSLGRNAHNHNAPLAPVEPFLDVAAHLPELLLVDDGANVARLVEWIAELERLDLLPKRIEELVEDIAVEEEARSRGA